MRTEKVLALLLERAKCLSFSPASKPQSTWIQVPGHAANEANDIGAGNNQRLDSLDAIVYSMRYLNNVERTNLMVKNIKVGVKVLYTLEIEDAQSINHIIINSGDKCIFTVMKNAEEHTITGTVIKLVENKYIHEESYFMVDVSTSAGAAYEFITLRNIITVVKT